MYGIPKPSPVSATIGSGLPFLLLSLAALALVLFIIWRLVHSPYGLMLQGIRDDELVVSTLGRDVTRAKVVVFAIAGGLAAVAGGLYATFYGVIDPSAFGVPVIILLWSMLFIGGAGTCTVLCSARACCCSCLRVCDCWASRASRRARSSR